MINTKLITALLALMIKESICLRVIEVAVPRYKVRGEEALLECQYELLGDTLYSVKWYKDNEEFYRYMPKITPPQQSFRIDGIKVDHHMSNDKKVVLKGLNLKSTGLYRCEASAEAPWFSSASGEGRLDVISLPKDGPFIEGDTREYVVGDTLNLNCTSGKSYPASDLHWYVNEKKITDSNELIDYGIFKHAHGLETTILGLKLTVGSNHMLGKSLNAKCVASAPWLKSSNTIGRAAPLTDNREISLLVRSGCANNFDSYKIIRVLFVVYLLYRDTNLNT